MTQKYMCFSVGLITGVTACTVCSILKVLRSEKVMGLKENVMETANDLVVGAEEMLKDKVKDLFDYIESIGDGEWKEVKTQVKKTVQKKMSAIKDMF